MTSSAVRHGAVLSLFTGAGGLDRGLEAAGLETIGCIENDPVCIRTLEANRPGWKILDQSDIEAAARTLTPASLGFRVGELDVLAGGPPCQPFSMAGQWTSSGRQGMLDSRARTVIAVLDLIAAFLPRVILIENVVGFLNGATSALPVIEARLRAINKKFGVSYELVASVVDCADFGVPQHRRRVVAVASRDGARFQFPPPLHIEAQRTAWDALFDLREKVVPEPQGAWAGLLPSIPEGGNYQFLTAKGEGEELFGYRTKYWSFLLKLARNRPAWTLPANPGPSTGPFHWDNRPLSTRERMRLQSFPDDWHVVGSSRESMKQIGNATPPLLAEVVGRALVEQILSPKAHFSGPPSLLRPRATKLTRARKPLPVPDHFRAMIGPKPAHAGPGKGPAPRT